jgi:hypothetical protein
MMGLVMYLGLGVALGLLRRRQGHGRAEAILAGISWPLEFLCLGLQLIGERLKQAIEWNAQPLNRSSC